VSFPLQPPVTAPMVDLKTGLVTQPWIQFFTRISAKMNSAELNFTTEAPDKLIWTDPDGNPHEIVS
jgi:hypothetical protein